MCFVPVNLCSVSGAVQEAYFRDTSQLPPTPLAIDSLQPPEIPDASAHSDWLNCGDGPYELKIH